MSTKEIQENLVLAQTILEQWLKVKQYFLLGISSQEITEEDEAEYLATTSEIAQNSRKLSQRIDEKRYPFRREEISALLKTVVAVKQFRQMPLQDQKKFEADWHSTLVYLSRTVGACKFLADGYRLQSSIKSKKASNAKRSALVKKIAIAVVVLLVAAGVAAFFLELV